jgi:hypothetical protein
MPPVADAVDREKGDKHCPVDFPLVPEAKLSDAVVGIAKGEEDSSDEDSADDLDFNILTYLDLDQ